MLPFGVLGRSLVFVVAGLPEDIQAFVDVVALDPPAPQDGGHD